MYEVFKMKRGSTSVIVEITIENSSVATQAGLTGLAFGTAGLTCYYKQDTDTVSRAVTLATIATLGTWATGGFKEVDATNMPGLYEFHIPNTALASGNKVTFQLQGATNMKQTRFTVELDAVDYQDANAFGLAYLTRLVNALAPLTGSATVTTLTATAFSSSLSTALANDFWKGASVTFITGTLAGQSRPITGYTASPNALLSFAAGFTGAPANGDTFVITNNASGFLNLSTTEEAAIVTAIGAMVIESGIPLTKILQYIGAEAAGDYDAATGTFRGVGNHGTTRITAALAAGNRTNTLS